MALSPTAVAALVRAQGINGPGAVALVAIAYRESGGNPRATHRNANGTVDNGLWQINRPTLTPALLDPQANARAMGELYRARGLEPWTFGTTHGTSTYRQWLPMARRAVRAAPRGTAGARTASRPGGPARTGKGADAALLASLRARAAQGLQGNEPAVVTITAMLATFERSGRHYHGAGGDLGYVSSIYDAVKGQPSSWDKWLANPTVPGLAGFSLDNIPAYLKIAAGGLVILLGFVGLLVAVAARTNAADVAASAIPGGSIARDAVKRRRAPQVAARAAARSEAQTERTKLARQRYSVETETTARRRGGERTRVRVRRLSSSEARDRAGAEGELLSSEREERRAEGRAALAEHRRRRSTPRTHIGVRA